MISHSKNDTTEQPKTGTFVNIISKLLQEYVGHMVKFTTTLNYAYVG